MTVETMPWPRTRAAELTSTRHEVILLKIADRPTVMFGANGRIVLGSRGGEGSIGFGVNPVHPIHLAGGAHCFEGREWRNGSSISCKKDVENLPLA